ncbi:pilus assembly protein PilP [Geothrix alkalitolerans]|uniref:pilus assembly protein PilP n=1 Tax=Geothrix alkalitolerans TaxID=2922724 RepID=UPI001FAF0EE2|nr:pilus assembly protein PilP [Geothrix alkalitolerans]
MIHRLLLLPLLAGLTLAAQTGPAAKPAEAPAATTTAPEVPAQDVAVIKITPYKPTIQRDPFSTPRDDRPADALDLIDDISVKGMIRKDGKNFAIVSDSRGTVRWLPVGHRFKDGEIASITDKAVTFHQWDVNTTNRSIFRTITKLFKREEGKR